MHPRLESYLNSKFVQSIHFDPESGCYSFYEHGVRQYCGGLLNKLSRKYYPSFNYKRKDGRSWKRYKKGSNDKQGKRVDREIEEYIESEKKPRHKMSQVLIDYWKSEGHTLQAAQVPVRVKEFGIITEADVITMDDKGRLWMWEVKTGYPSRAKQKQRYLKNTGSQKVTNTRFNHWELQRHYTAQALIDAGVPIYQSRVINVYEQWQKKEKKKLLNITARKPAPWTKKVLGKRKRE